MDPRLTELLREVEESCRQRGGTPRVTREAAQFLNILVKATRATSLLQVGVEDGAMTLWLGEAVAHTDGHLTAVEGNVWVYDDARLILERSPFPERISLRQGNTVELLSVLEGPFDFVLLDGNNGQALQHFHLLVEKIKSGGLICCHKAMTRVGPLTDYLSYVHERPGLDSTLIPVGEGIEITYMAP